MPEDDLEKIKKEISFHALCKPCRNCGQCDRILKLAIDEAKSLSSDEKRKPCESCRM